jgi:broad specificity phosphatase PhoE
VYDGQERQGYVKEAVLEVQGSWNDGKLDANLEEGESAYEAEIRSVNKLYEIILERAADPECESIVFILHGRLLRIMLASMLHQDLTKMHLFTHHNTTVNIVDAIISPEKKRECADNEFKPEFSMANHDQRVIFKGVLFDSYSHLTDAGDASNVFTPLI